MKLKRNSIIMCKFSPSLTAAIVAAVSFTLVLGQTLDDGMPPTIVSEFNDASETVDEFGEDDESAGLSGRTSRSRWKSQIITWMIDYSKPYQRNQEGARRDIASAFGVWERDVGIFRFIEVHDARDADILVQFNFEPQISAHAFVRKENKIVRIVVNTKYEWIVDRPITEYEAHKPVHLWSVMLHEVGHVLGLGHNSRASEQESIMSYNSANQYPGFRLSRRDIREVLVRYPLYSVIVAGYQLPPFRPVMPYRLREDDPVNIDPIHVYNLAPVMPKLPEYVKRELYRPNPFASPPTEPYRVFNYPSTFESERREFPERRYFDQKPEPDDPNSGSGGDYPPQRPYYPSPNYPPPNYPPQNPNYPPPNYPPQDPNRGSDTGDYFPNPDNNPNNEKLHIAPYVRDLFAFKRGHRFWRFNVPRGNAHAVLDTSQLLPFPAQLSREHNIESVYSTATGLTFVIDGQVYRFRGRRLEPGYPMPVAFDVPDRMIVSVNRSPRSPDISFFVMRDGTIVEFNERSQRVERSSNARPQR